MTLAQQTKLCTRCHLRSGCRQVIPGIGPERSNLFFIGEAPGHEEDLLGQPFVGLSGQLLDKLLDEAGINRADVYITNAVKCRPPGNATPDSKAIQTCKTWLWQELKLVEPKMIVTLGRVATSLLLKLKPNESRMADLVGRTYPVNYMSARVMPIYHPSYLLRRNGQLNSMVVTWLKRAKDISNG